MGWVTRGVSRRLYLMPNKRRIVIKCVFLKPVSTSIARSKIHWQLLLSLLAKGCGIKETPICTICHQKELITYCCPATEYPPPWAVTTKLHQQWKFNTIKIQNWINIHNSRKQKRLLCAKEMTKVATRRTRIMFWMDSRIASIRKQFTPFTIIKLGYPRKRKKKRKKDSSQVFHHRG